MHSIETCVHNCTYAHRDIRIRNHSHTAHKQRACHETIEPEIHGESHTTPFDSSKSKKRPPKTHAY